MDTPPTSPNTPASSERPGGNLPEQFKPEQASAPGGGEKLSGNPASGGGPAPQKLSAADVAAALAATPTVGSGTPGTPQSASPAVAGDVDVIEPEWVDKAEEAIRSHQGDPYGEEEAVEKLQEEYLQKRYGISVADPDADETKPKGA